MLKFTDPELEIYKHSASHVLAQAVLRLYPNTKLGIGPATDTGFYYDFALPKEAEKVAEGELLENLQVEIQHIIEEELPFTQVNLPLDEAMDMLHQQGQIFKSELLQQISDPEISFFKTGDEFIDLCRGPHVKDTGKIAAIKLKGISKSHWLGDPDRPLLSRISGIVFMTKQDYQEYLDLQASLQDRTQMKLAAKLKIFLPHNDQGSYSYTLLEHGLRLESILSEKFNSALADEGFTKINFAPYWKLTNLQQNSLTELLDPREIIQVGGDYVITNNQTLQYADYLMQQRLPYWKEQEAGDILIKTAYDNVKYYEPNEKGAGLYNQLATKEIRTYTLVAQNLWLRELRLQMQFLIGFYRKLLPNGLKIAYDCNDQTLTDELLQVFGELRLDAKKTSSKADLEVQLIYFDVFEKEHILASISATKAVSQAIQRLAYQKLFPEINHPEKNNNLPRLTLLEMSATRNLQGLMALLLEETAGDFPIEIAPYQVLIIPATEKYHSYARSIYAQLLKQQVRAKLDLRDLSLEKKQKEAVTLQYPFIVSVSEQEETNQVLSVKPGSGEDLGLMTLTEFLQKSNLALPS